MVNEKRLENLGLKIEPFCQQSFLSTCCFKFILVYSGEWWETQVPCLSEFSSADWKFPTLSSLNTYFGHRALPLLFPLLLSISDHFFAACWSHKYLLPSLFPLELLCKQYKNSKWSFCLCSLSFSLSKAISTRQVICALWVDKKVCLLSLFLFKLYILFFGIEQFCAMFCLFQINKTA